MGAGETEPVHVKPDSTGLCQHHLKLYIPCLTAWGWFLWSSRPRAGDMHHSVYLRLLIVQRIDENFPYRWVKALIDIDLFPNLFWGILIVMPLFPGHRLTVLPMILYQVRNTVDEVRDKVFPFFSGRLASASRSVTT